MNKILRIGLVFLLPLALFAYEDYDMDGVDDAIDKCPNSLITDLVDINGCTTKELVSPHHYDIVLGLSYSQLDEVTAVTDTITQNVQFDYYYKSFSFQVSTSYYYSKSGSFSTNGLNDTFIAAYYELKPLQDLSVRLGAGIALPTYETNLDNNNMDYVTSADISYALKTMNIFGGYSFTLMNDDDIDTLAIKYQNVNSFYGGLGFYPSSKLYVSASYSSSDSVYDGGQTIQSASVYSYYAIDENWFSSFNYGYGLSDSASDYSASVRVGYYF